MLIFNEDFDWNLRNIQNFIQQVNSFKATAIERQDEEIAAAEARREEGARQRQAEMERLLLQERARQARENAVPPLAPGVTLPPAPPPPVSSLVGSRADHRLPPIPLDAQLRARVAGVGRPGARQGDGRSQDGKFEPLEQQGDKSQLGREEYLKNPEKFEGSLDAAYSDKASVNQGKNKIDNFVARAEAKKLEIEGGASKAAKQQAELLGEMETKEGAEYLNAIRDSRSDRKDSLDRQKNISIENAQYEDKVSQEVDLDPAQLLFKFIQTDREYSSYKRKSAAADLSSYEYSKDDIGNASDVVEKLSEIYLEEDSLVKTAKAISYIKAFEEKCQELKSASLEYEDGSMESNLLDLQDAAKSYGRLALVRVKIARGEFKGFVGELEEGQRGSPSTPSR